MCAGCGWSTPLTGLLRWSTPLTDWAATSVAEHSYALAFGNRNSLWQAGARAGEGAIIIKFVT